MDLELLKNLYRAAYDEIYVFCPITTSNLISLIQAKFFSFKFHLAIAREKEIYQKRLFPACGILGDYLEENGFTEFAEYARDGSPTIAVVQCLHPHEGCVVDWLNEF